MTQDGTGKDDVKVPDSELGQQIEAEFNDGKDVRETLNYFLLSGLESDNVIATAYLQLYVTIVSAMGEEQAISFKEAPVGFFFFKTEKCQDRFTDSLSRRARKGSSLVGLGSVYTVSSSFALFTTLSVRQTPLLLFLYCCLHSITLFSEDESPLPIFPPNP
jgi:hypothetical protein